MDTDAPPATNNFYRAWRSPKKVLMQKSQKFCADFKYVNLKIELLQIFEKKSFSSLFLMRKPLSSDQKWFLRPYFPLSEELNPKLSYGPDSPQKYTKSLTGETVMFADYHAE